MIKTKNRKRKSYRLICKRTYKMCSSLFLFLWAFTHSVAVSALEYQEWKKGNYVTHHGQGIPTYSGHPTPESVTFLSTGHPSFHLVFQKLTGQEGEPKIPMKKERYLKIVSFKLIELAEFFLYRKEGFKDEEDDVNFYGNDGSLAIHRPTQASLLFLNYAYKNQTY